MPSSVSLRAARLAALVVTAVAAAVLLSGPLANALAATGWRFEFGSLFRRLALVLVLAALAWELRPWRDVPPDLWGLRGPRSKPWHLLAGAAIAVAILGAVVALDAALGRVAWDHADGRAKWAHRWPEALARGALLGPLEEAFFRGWLLDRCLRRWKPLTACAVASVAFALPHLFKASVAPKGMEPGVASALDALATWFHGIADVGTNAPRMAGLFLLGTALAAARLRSGSLWLPIGIHAAGVVVVDAVSALTTRTPERDALGSKWLYDGAPAWALLVVLFLLLRPRGAGAPPPAESAT